MGKFYITTAIPYVNAKPHVGHALEFVQADVIARFHRVIGDETLLLSGGDENALKNVQAAQKENKDIKQFVDENSKLFEDLAQRLGVKFDVFQKGSNPAHHSASGHLWELCKNDIYKKTYTGLYCVGCEVFYETNELNEQGECFEHPGKKLEQVSEENYFFKLSKYQDKLEKLIASDELKIIPTHRKNEMLSFITSGLKDISISRSNERAKNWGVSVPGDNSQKMYVWFDALNIYQSGVGFGTDEEKYHKWWPADLHVIGKGILRFHAVYWPAFLMSAKLPLPKSLFVHGYFTVDGQKMSKTLGNVIDPNIIIDRYGADTLRYYLLTNIASTGDGDFSEDKLKEVYNADLANGLGNLISRVAKLCENASYIQTLGPQTYSLHLMDIKDYAKALDEYKFNEALTFIWRKIAKLNAFIDQEKPWDLIKTKSPHISDILAHAIDQIQEIAGLLEPFLPDTARQIENQFNVSEIKSKPPMFPRAI